MNSCKGGGTLPVCSATLTFLQYAVIAQGYLRCYLHSIPQFCEAPPPTGSQIEDGCRTPAEMQQIMEAILAAYDSNVSRSQASSGMQQDANGLMNPKVIEQMRVLLGELRKNYL